MKNPKYIQIDDIKYKINTDFKVAIRVNEVVQDNTICDYEKILGIITLLFDEEGINHPEHYERLLISGLNYLQGRPSSTTGKRIKDKSKRDMDYKQDWGLIVASMRSEYGININEENMHWWDFFDLLNGLSSECILNKVREIRTRDISKEKDDKYKEEIIKLKELYSLDETKPITKEQQESIDTFYKLTGIERK